MIDYTLAKELKEAGFPTSTRWAVEHNYKRHICVQGDATKPHIMELIEEVDNLDVFSIKRLPHTWQAYVARKSRHIEDKGEIQEQAIGDTMEEAVAKLWLALKK